MDRKQLAQMAEIQDAATDQQIAEQEYLLERRLFRRRSTGAVIDYDKKDGPDGGRGHPAWTLSFAKTSSAFSFNNLGNPNITC